MIFLFHLARITSSASHMAGIIISFMRLRYWIRPRESSLMPRNHFFRRIHLNVNQHEQQNKTRRWCREIIENFHREGMRRYHRNINVRLPIASTQLLTFPRCSMEVFASSGVGGDGDSKCRIIRPRTHSLVSHIHGPFIHIHRECRKSSLVATFN